MKDDTIAIDGEIYISSSRAGKQFGYASDYIGFLAREGKIKSRIIGRTRFVGRKSLANYKLLSKNANYQSQKAAASPVWDISRKESVRTADIKAVTNFNITRSLVLAAILISLILPPLVSNLADYVFSFDPGSVIGRQPYARIDNFNDEKFLVASVQPSISDFISKVKNESHKLDEELFNFLNSTSGQITNFVNSLGTKLAQLGREVRTILVGETEIIEVAVTGPSTSTSTSTAPASSIPGIVYPILEEEKISATPTPSQPAPAVERLGLGVFPSAGDKNVDERLIRTIQESFSDEVKVRFDESRRTGIITPVFRQRSDDNYIFVLVPVKENGDGL